MGCYTLCTASLILTLCPVSMCASPQAPSLFLPLWFAQWELTPVLEPHCVCWGLQQVLDWAQLLSLTFSPTPNPTPSPRFTQVCTHFSVQLSDMSLLSRQCFVNYRGPACRNFKRRPPSHHIFRGCIIFKHNLNIYILLLNSV